jgi:hypothetical protein
VKCPRADIFDVVCSGCGFTLNLSKDIRVHSCKTREGKVLWAVFFEETAEEERKMQESEMADDTTLLEQFRDGLGLLERWTLDPKLIADPATIRKGLISCGLGYGSLGISDKIVMRYLGTIHHTERWEDDWKNYLRLTNEN